MEVHGKEDYANRLVSSPSCRNCNRGYREALARISPRVVVACQAQFGVLQTSTQLLRRNRGRTATVVVTDSSVTIVAHPGRIRRLVLWIPVASGALLRFACSSRTAASKRHKDPDQCASLLTAHFPKSRRR